MNDGRHGLRVAQVIPGINNEIRLKLGELTDPQLLQLLVGQHVKVGDMEDTEFVTPSPKSAFVQHGDGCDGEAESAGTE